MYAPEWVCRKLSDFHPNLRIGWDGKERTFGLVHLYHWSDAQKTYRQFWQDHGPIFSKSGRPRPDWDLHQRVPVYIIDVTPQDVFSGKIVALVKRWVRPIASRVYTSAIAEGKRRETYENDRAGEQADKVYWKSQRRGYHAPVVAKKFRSRTANAIRNERGEFDLTKRFLPPEPEYGWSKALENDKGDADDLGSI